MLRANSAARRQYLTRPDAPYAAQKDSEFARDCSGSRFPFPVLVLTWLYRDRTLK
jgi:hypothetical protein